MGNCMYLGRGLRQNGVRALRVSCRQTCGGMLTLSICVMTAATVTAGWTPILSQNVRYAENVDDSVTNMWEFTGYHGISSSGGGLPGASFGFSSTFIRSFLDISVTAETNGLFGYDGPALSRSTNTVVFDLSGNRTFDFEYASDLPDGMATVTMEGAMGTVWEIANCDGSMCSGVDRIRLDAGRYTITQSVTRQTDSMPPDAVGRATTSLYIFLPEPEMNAGLLLVVGFWLLRRRPSVTDSPCAA